MSFYIVQNSGSQFDTQTEWPLHTHTQNKSSLRTAHSANRCSQCRKTQLKTWTHESGNEWEGRRKESADRQRALNWSFSPPLCLSPRLHHNLKEITANQRCICCSARLWRNRFILQFYVQLLVTCFIGAFNVSKITGSKRHRFMVVLCKITKGWHAS